uniref:Putative secreted protein n=1 Tax=Desmodus rotundus TaxID=9430 RepID=K9IZD8_DESRO
MVGGAWSRGLWSLSVVSGWVGAGCSLGSGTSGPVSWEPSLARDSYSGCAGTSGPGVGAGLWEAPAEFPPFPPARAAWLCGHFQLDEAKSSTCAPPEPRVPGPGEWPLPTGWARVRQRVAKDLAEWMGILRLQPLLCTTSKPSDANTCGASQAAKAIGLSPGRASTRGKLCSRGHVPKARPRGGPPPPAPWGKVWPPRSVSSCWERGEGDWPGQGQLGHPFGAGERIRVTPVFPKGGPAHLKSCKQDSAPSGWGCGLGRLPTKCRGRAL